VLCVKLRIILSAESDEHPSSSSVAATALGLGRVHETFRTLIRDFCEKK